MGLAGLLPVSVRAPQWGTLAEGHIHALWAILGMIFGASVYAEVFPFLSKTVQTWLNFRKISLPQALGLSTWIIIPVFVCVGAVIFILFDKNGLWPLSFFASRNELRVFNLVYALARLYGHCLGYCLLKKYFYYPSVEPD